MPLSAASLQWLTLVAIIWLQALNATNSDFPAYSSQLKHLLSISQVQLNNLAFASDAGKLFGWLSGIAAARLPLWLVLLVGALLGSIGYGIQFLFLANTITSLPYWQIFVLCALAGNSICWINTVCYVATIHNFPLDRQIAVGLSSSYFGLSAKIYTSMNDVIFQGSAAEKAKGYLLLNAAVPMVASIITAPLVRKIKAERPAPMGGGFLAMFFITIATGVYSVIGSVGYFSTHLSSMVHAVGLGALLLAPLAVPTTTIFVDGFAGKWASCKRERRVYDFSIDEGSFGGHVVEIDVKEEPGVADEAGGERMMMGLGEERGVWEMVKTSEFWLYFFVYMFGGTLGLVFLNNLGQIAESRGLYNTSSLVSLSSSFGFFGRLIPSIVDYFLTKNKFFISSTAAISAFTAPMAGAFFLLLNPTNLSLYISTAVIGVCTGAITSIAVSTTTELFGSKNFSVNHNIIVANIPIGSFTFGILAALLYQSQSKNQNNGGKCLGFECYKETFVIWGCFCSLGTLLSLILYMITRKKYLTRS